MWVLVVTSGASASFEESSSMESEASSSASACRSCAASSSFDVEVEGELDVELEGDADSSALTDRRCLAFRSDGRGFDEAAAFSGGRAGDPYCGGWPGREWSTQ